MKKLHVHDDEHKQFKKLQSKAKEIVKLKSRGTSMLCLVSTTFITQSCYVHK